MKPLVRIISLVLCVALCMSLFGCGGSGGSETGGGKAKEVEKVLLDEPVTFTLFTYEHPNQRFNVEADKFKEITRRTNVTLDINVVPGSAYNETAATMLASGNLCDINWLQQETIVKYSSDMYMDLTDILETKLPNYLRWIDTDSVFFKANKMNGKVVGLVTCSSQQYPLKDDDYVYGIYGKLPCIRTDLLEKHNLAVPTTFDELFTVLKALKKYYPDSTPFSVRTGISSLHDMEYSMCVRGDLYYDHDVGQYVLGCLRPQYKQVVEYWNKFYSEGILDPEYLSSDSNSWSSGILNNKVFFYYDNNSFAETQTLELQKNNPDAKMEVIPLMYGLDGKKRAISYADNWYEISYVLNAKTEHPDELLKFMNWCYSDEGMFTNCFGVEGIDYSLDKDLNVNLLKADQLKADYADKANAVYALKGDNGLGYLSFAPLVCDHAEFDLALGIIKKEDFGKATQALQADRKAGYLKTFFTPYFSVDSTVSTKYSAIQSLIRKYVNGFINGSISMTQWDTFVATVKQYGGEEVVAAYNAELQKAIS